MKKYFTLLCALMMTCLVGAKTIKYLPDNTTNLPNPERGFYHYSEMRLKGTGSVGLTADSPEFSKCDSDQITLIFHYVIMTKYNNGDPISAADLDALQKELDVVRGKGKKLIIRFQYGSRGYKDDDHWSFTEPTKKQMQAHMAQLKPILAANADIIACVQAGFVGIWGEWYFSSTFGKDWSKPGAVADRNELITSLLDMTPQDRYLQLRTIHYITEYDGPKDRLGHHNDAFCNNIDNCGTYYDYDIERAYLAVISEHTPIGGETNGGDSAYYAGEPSNKEMQLFHYDYMNSDYHPRVLNMWKRQQTPDGMSYYDMAARRLGYRFSLERLNYRSFVQLGDSVRITMDIHNAGWSNLYNARTVYLVLQSETQTYCLPMQTDPRQWLAGRTTRVSETIALPADITKGIYQLYLWLPDMYASLQANAAYSIRLANMDMVWEKGMNKLNTKLIIQ